MPHNPVTAPQILLIQPWIEDFYTTDCRTQPIGLGYLAASLKLTLKHIEVIIIDALAGKKKKSIPWPQEFKYLKPYYGRHDKGPFALFNQYYRFGKSRQELEQIISGYQPFLIGISSLFTPYYRQSLECARICKSIFPEVPVVMGGSHATLHPHTLMKTQSVNRKNLALCDYIIPGEAEIGICELAKLIKGEIAPEEVTSRIIMASGEPVGTDSEKISRKLKTPAQSPDIPNYLKLIPDLSTLDPLNYRFKGGKMAFLLTSRSCPYHCSFCSIHSVFSSPYRVRDIDDIIKEITQRLNEDIKHFDIEDDAFTENKPHAMELLQRIIRLGSPLTMSAMNGINYMTLDKQLLEKMKEAGFTGLNLSLVSAEDKVCRKCRRPHSLKHFDYIIDEAGLLKIPCIAYFIIGMPGQNVTDMWHTFSHLCGTQCLLGASPYYFTPLSPLHKKESGNPLIKLASRDGDSFLCARLTAMDLETETFTRQDIFTLFKLARVANYIKEGLDSGKGTQSLYFKPALQILNTGTWFTSREHHGLPFSKAIFNLIQEDTLTFKGYKTSRCIKYNPALNVFEPV